MAQWKNSKMPGVRFREHSERKHGKRPDRYFSIRYYIAKGKRKEQSLGWASEGWTEKKAYDMLCRFKENAKTGKGPTSINDVYQASEAESATKISFAEFVQSFYLPHSKARKKSATVRTEDIAIRKWFLPEFGKAAISDIGFTEIDKLHQAMVKSELSPRTIQYKMAMLRQIFNHAIDTGHYQGGNPAARVKVSVPDNSRIRFLSREEAGKLLHTLKTRSEELHNLAFISLNCGLRAGELFNLTWDCVDWEKKLLTIKDPKNKKTRRAFPPDSVFEVLRQVQRTSDTSLVFPDKRNGQKRSQVSHIFRKTVEQLGLNDGVTDRRDRVCFHTLRHTFASWMVEAGTDLYTVKELMGHSSIKMTERYAHLSPNKMREAMRIFEVYGRT